MSDDIVEMSWDPITRIVGSLGLYTKIDFGRGEVAECHSTSSIFRGYSVFMQGKRPTDAHLITSRICGICGDNHATCSVYAQNMAYGIRPPHLAEWIINLGEAAEYLFDHGLYQENLVGVDFSSQVVGATNPGVLEQARRTESPNAAIHGYRTIGDIMDGFTPFEGAIYRQSLSVSRTTREMFCLMEGRHVHPSTVHPGGVGTVADESLFNAYESRLLEVAEWMKIAVPLHDDLFDFIYDAMPGYEEVGRRPIQLGCWGAFQDPQACDFTYRRMADWGRKMFVTPGVVVGDELLTTDLVDINLGIRIKTGSSYYDGWQGREKFVTADPLGNPVHDLHPWNQHTLPRPADRDFDDKYSWVMSPRWNNGTEDLALETGGGPLARLWVTSKAGIVDTDAVRATGTGCDINLPATPNAPETTFHWAIPGMVNTIERNRARTYFQAYAAAIAFHFLAEARRELRFGDRSVSTPYEVPDEGISCGFTEAVRGVLSHHMVIKDGLIANYHPYPPTSWNASPRDEDGVWGPYEDAIRGTPLFEESARDDFQGIDIMRTVRSFDPCLPCGVHMYVGGGKTIEQRHSPTMMYEP